MPTNPTTHPSTHPGIPVDHDVEGFAFDAFHVGTDKVLLPAVRAEGIPLIRGTLGASGWDVHGWDRTVRKAG